MSAANPSEALSWAFMRAHPEDAARALETLPPADVVAMMQELPARITANVLQHARPSLAAAVLHGVDRNRGSALLAMLETSMAARVLRQVTEERRIALRLILAVPDNSIGAWVDADVVSLTGEITAADARQRAVSASSNVERIVLLDDRDRPIAWVALHDLLRAAPDTPVSRIAMPLPAVLVAAMPLSAGLLHPAWRSSSVLPVTTRLGTFIGLLRHERLQRVHDQDAASRGASISSASGALALGYFHCVTGMLRGGLTLLPKVRALSEIPDER